MLMEAQKRQIEMVVEDDRPLGGGRLKLLVASVPEEHADTLDEVLIFWK